VADTSLEPQLQELERRALDDVAKAPDPEALKAVEVAYLGRKGELKQILDGIGGLPADERPRAGAAGNQVKQRVLAAIEGRRGRLESGELEQRIQAERLDVTLPGRPMPRGSLHPVIETIREIARILGQFGFVSYEGPEVETDELNFQLLNIPPDHPARDLWDTLYLKPPPDSVRPSPARSASAEPSAKTSSAKGSANGDGRLLLRTHTSPGQIRVMRSTSPPIRALLPGRCFRYENIDASRAFEFFQVEGLMVDEGTTMAHLRGLLDEVAHALFGKDRPTRFRPGYYPFTEPSVAFDVQCVICDGRGCPACRRTGWMTILGAGMVHPVVLRNGGIDPERFQGFAFGMGPDRMTMLRYGIDDIRYFLANDLRFLEQF
jgi:phenylalanyl-tRNA synthetase alpha chain